MPNQQAATINGDLVVGGKVYCNGINAAISITDANVASGAGIAATKLQHQYEKGYAQESATTATAETRFTHYVYGGTGTLVEFRAGAVVANVGAATVTVDLLKNGSSILAAAITLTSADAAYATHISAFSNAALVAGDKLEIKITVAAGGGTLAKGVFAQVTLREDPQ